MPQVVRMVARWAHCWAEPTEEKKVVMSALMMVVMTAAQMVVKRVVWWEVRTVVWWARLMAGMMVGQLEVTSAANWADLKAG